ncbi:MAG TPA: ornithine cyclodeaminase family protein [Gemmatimonadaceae bacterium]|nr:ornithine cyclodeaminase family protein [Gemmatimonadaceae bacterium]
MTATATLELDGRPTIILRQTDVRRMLSMPACIAAVEHAFVSHARGETLGPAVIGVHADGGGFHVKAAGLREARRAVFAVKINANFPENSARFGLPTIQGVLGLFDAANGRLLALMDSIEITSLRTAAATAVAAKHLAPTIADVVICGCGEQSRHQLRALACVRSVRRVRAFDVERARAATFADDMQSELGIAVSAVDDVRAGRDATIWITCTPSRQWFLAREHVAAGSFVAAVGADNPEKQELEPELLSANVVIADVLDQSATIGDLHHAITSGVMRREDVRGELADVVSGRIRGRRSDDEIVIFDSTGTALQDVAAAAVVYEHAVARGGCLTIDFQT